MGRRTFFPLACTALILISGCSSAVDDATAKQFQAAEDAFATADSESEFLNVAGRYQEILDGGFESGTVLYNQGNAFLKANQPGRAIAAYQQAKRFRPTDPLLDSNLRTAFAKTGTTPATSIVDRLLFWQNWVSYKGKFVWTTVLLAITMGCLFASRFVSRKIMRRLGLMASVLTLMAAASTAYDWYRFEVQQHGVIAERSVIARKGAAESYDPAFTEPLPEGTLFTVGEKVADWVRIEVGESDSAWVPVTSVVIY